MLIDKLLTVNSTSFPIEVGSKKWERATPEIDNFYPDNPDANPFAFSNHAGFGNVVCNNSTHVFCTTPFSAYLYALNINDGSLAYTVNFLEFGANMIGWSHNCGSQAASVHAGQPSIACTDTFLVVGSARYTQQGYAYSGVAHVLNAATGQLIFTLNNPNPIGTFASDYFGHSVAINDNYVVVGSPMEDWGSLNGGAFYVFSLVNGALVYSKGSYNLTGSGGSTQAYDGAGFKVACNSTLVAVSAPEEDYGFSNAGVIYVYNIATGNLVYTIYNPKHDQPETYSNSTFFGSAISMSESYLLVGQPNAYTITEARVGVAYLFDLSSGLLLRTFNNPKVEGVVGDNDKFGSAVAVSEQYSIIANIGDWSYQSDPLYPPYPEPGYNLYCLRHLDIYDNTTGFLVKRIYSPGFNGAVVEGDPYEGFGACVSVYNDVFCVGDPTVIHKDVTYAGGMYAYRL